MRKALLPIAIVGALSLSGCASYGFGGIGGALMATVPITDMAIMVATISNAPLSMPAGVKLRAMGECRSTLSIRKAAIGWWSPGVWKRAVVIAIASVAPSTEVVGSPISGASDTRAAMAMRACKRVGAQPFQPA